MVPGFLLARSRIVFVFLLSLLYGVLAGSEADAQRIAFQSYGKADGLTNAWFSCLQQDRSGYVFACTEHGLYAYDGRRFFNLGPKQGLPEGGIASGLVFDVAGRLIVRYPHGIFVSIGPVGPHTPPAALRFQVAVSAAGVIPDDPAGALVPWDGGAIFAGQGRLYRVRTKTADGPPTVEFADSLHPPGALQDPSPLAVAGTTLWAVRSDESICRVGMSVPRCFGRAEGVPPERWVALLTTHDGHLLARSLSRLADIDPGTGHVDISPLPDQGGRYANYPMTLLLALTPSGQALTQSAAGLIIRDRSGWKRLATENGPPVPIARLMFDRQGNLWLAALGRGLMRALGYGAWENLDHHDGLSDDVLWQMARQPGGPLWVASDGGVDAVGGPPGVMLARRHYDQAAFSIAFDALGRLWRSVGSNGVACITVGSGATIQYPLAQTSQILHGSNARLWFITEKGVYFVDGAAAPKAPQPVAGLSGLVTTAAVAPDDTLWVLRGPELLHRHGDGSIVSIRLRWQQAEFDPLTLTTGPAGVIWIAGIGGGLYRLQLDGDRIVSSTWFQPPDIISNSIVSLLVDGRGWLWAGTDNGISVFNGQRWVSATADEGLIWDDLDQGGLLEDADGSMWIGTSQGLSHLLDPTQLFTLENLKPVISSVVVGETAYREHAVPYTREPFVIRFGSLDFRAGGVIRFRYRLDGVDKDWADTASGYARYPSVPPGHHRFELIAYDPLTHQVSAPLCVLLRVSEPWWLWWPLLVLYAAAGLGSAYGILRLRVRFLVQQRRALQREVELRTAEIREAQATDSLTGLLTRGEIQSRVVGALAHAGRSSQIVVGLLDIDHFKRINDRFGHLTGDEILKEMGRRLKLALQPGEHAGRYGGEEILIVIETDQIPEPDRIDILNIAACSEPFRVDGEIITVTCSIGVAHEHARDDWKSLIGRADKALYQAKTEGRDRIIVFAGNAMKLVSQKT